MPQIHVEMKMIVFEMIESRMLEGGAVMEESVYEDEEERRVVASS